MGNSAHTQMKKVLSGSVLHDTFLKFLRFQEDDFDMKFQSVIGEIRSPVGAAAGICRNGEALKSLFGAGFGFVEIGSITPLPERRKENAQLIEEDSVSLVGTQQRLGVMWLKMILQKNQFGPIGVNVQPNQQTAMAVPYQCNQAYTQCFRQLYPYISYYVINLTSSPSLDLEIYQEISALELLLKEIRMVADIQIGMEILKQVGIIQEKPQNPKKLVTPLFVKVNAGREDLKQVAEMCVRLGIDGIVLSGIDKQGRPATEEQF